MLNTIKSKIYPLVSNYFTHAVHVEGILKGTEQRFSCLLIDNSMYKEDLLIRVYSEPPVILRKWRIWNHSIKKIISSYYHSTDICIAVLPMKYESTLSGFYNFKGQEYVQQIIDTSDSWADIRKRFSKTKRQITNSLPTKYGLSYRISRDIKDFDFFYYRMHVPHITKQFADLSEIDSYDEMKEFFSKGFLLFVKKQNDDVAGALCRVKDGTMIFSRTGVLDGDEAHIKSGSQTAIYYFQLIYAKDQNLLKVDTMKSRPFLTDGVYMHKREWGAAVLPDGECRNWVYFFNTGPAEKIALFFEKNPVIVHSEKGLKGVLGISSGTDVSDASISDLTHRYNADGINGFTIMTPEGEISGGTEKKVLE